MPDHNVFVYGCPLPGDREESWPHPPIPKMECFDISPPKRKKKITARRGECALEVDIDGPMDEADKEWIKGLFDILLAVKN